MALNISKRQIDELMTRISHARRDQRSYTGHRDNRDLKIGVEVDIVSELLRGYCLSENIPFPDSCLSIEQQMQQDRWRHKQDHQLRSAAYNNESTIRTEQYRNYNGELKMKVEDEFSTRVNDFVESVGISDDILMQRMSKEAYRNALLCNRTISTTNLSPPISLAPKPVAKDWDKNVKMPEVMASTFLPAVKE